MDALCVCVCVCVYAGRQTGRDDSKTSVTGELDIINGRKERYGNRELLTAER